MAELTTRFRYVKRVQPEPEASSRLRRGYDAVTLMLRAVILGLLMLGVFSFAAIVLGVSLLRRAFRSSSDAPESADARS